MLSARTAARRCSSAATKSADLRCVYHGWKFDRNGACVDMPSEPPRLALQDQGHDCGVSDLGRRRHRLGVHGPARQSNRRRPTTSGCAPPKRIAWFRRRIEDSNWLQGLEGGLDTAHSSFLHNEKLGDKSLLRSRDGHPRLEVEKSAYGFRYASLRDLGDDGLYARIYQYMMPWQQQRGSVTALNGGRNKVPKAAGHIWAPIDDTHTFVYNTLVSYDEQIPIPDAYAWEDEARFGRGKDDMLPGFRLRANMANDYYIDRNLQKTTTYTGIRGINTQDMALQEGMGADLRSFQGALRDERSRGHCGTAALTRGVRCSRTRRGSAGVRSCDVSERAPLRQLPRARRRLARGLRKRTRCQVVIVRRGRFTLGYKSF